MTRHVTVVGMDVVIPARELRLNDFSLELIKVGHMKFDLRHMYEVDGVLYWRPAAIPPSPIWEFGVSDDA